MKHSEIAQFRLSQQQLTAPSFKNPAEVVAWLGAVQAQDFPASKWALGLRMKSATDETIEKAYNAGEILRTHIMRPTWHYVLPADIRWLQELTAPRVKALLASYDRKLEITEKVLSRSSSVIAQALGNKQYLTRADIANCLEKNKITARGQRLAHLVMHAELDAVICSGPLQGKQFTYALLDERVPPTRPIDRGQALAKLTLKYFVSHGPAQVKDFAWWSGLTVKEAMSGIEMVKPKLVEEIIDGKTYYFSASAAVKKNSSCTFLLSIYDEYVIAYKDRGALGAERYAEKFLSMGNALTSVLILDGKIIGTWKRVLKKDTVEIKLNPLRKLAKNEQEAVRGAAQRYGKFLKRDVLI